MGTGKVLKNYMMQLLIQNLWSFTSEQKPGLTFLLSARSRENRVIRPPKATFNTNPYLASFLTGVIIREQHKKGAEGVSSILESTLAAHGDDLYWRVLRPAALLAGMVLVIVGQPLAGLCVFLVGFNFFAQGERLVGYARGLKKGRKAFTEVVTSITRIKKIVLPLAGGLVGLLCAVFIFNLDASRSLVTEGWFVFIPLFGISFVFAFLRISPLFNLLVNLLIVVVLGVLL
jgi:mannose/fructose/N-acetylgalactosamine-specific phosphotransferase system component IID